MRVLERIHCMNTVIGQEDLRYEGDCLPHRPDRVVRESLAGHSGRYDNGNEIFKMTGMEAIMTKRIGPDDDPKFHKRTKGIAEAENEIQLIGGLVHKV